jgi:hypothetical protein
MNFYYLPNLKLLYMIGQILRENQDMKKILTKLSLVSLLAVPFSSYAWNAVGHMVIANIAYNNLNSTAKSKVDSLVSSFNKEYPDVQDFSQMADWPDALHEQKAEAFSRWHYIDYPVSSDGSKTESNIATDNAVWAIGVLKPVVGNDKGNAYERARSLAFLAHVVGDLHQPLHTVSNYTHTHPNGDKGGNSYSLSYNHTNMSAHRLWDEGVGIFDGGTSESQIQQVSQTLMTLYPKTSFGNQASDANVTNWTNEGIKNATNYVYDTPENKPVSNEYINAGQKVAGQEAALAGYRLAAMLNALLG